jgi:DnaJ-class molecular chaperone
MQGQATDLDKVACSVCDGTGFYPYPDGLPCAPCEGRGWFRKVTLDELVERSREGQKRPEPEA